MAFRKQGVDKQAWLDWLNDEPQSAAAQTEVRARRREQANRYQSRPVAPPPLASPPAQVSKPTNSADKPAVSIQIQIPAWDTARWRRRWQQLVAWLRRQYQRLARIVVAHKGRSIAGAVAVFVIVAGLFVPHIVHFGNDAKSASNGAAGSSGSSSAGGDTGYDKPPFEVVVPSSKPKLATPDGAHSAYDGKKNSFSFSDSIKGNGIIVSQQPIPAQFKEGSEAVTSVAKQLTNSVSSARSIDTLFGPAQVLTNSKYSSQTVVFTIRDLLLFIQSSHSFSDSDWSDYINALQ